MKKGTFILLLSVVVMPAMAQSVLSLDSCRSLALRNNKQMGIAQLKTEVAKNTRKAARTKYLPKLSAAGGYEFVSREVSLLSKDQKTRLSNLGTKTVNDLGTTASSLISSMAQDGVISSAEAQKASQMFSNYGTSLSQTFASSINNIGQAVVDGLRTDTRNIFALSVMMRQPIYMGGAITAANRMADISEAMAANSRQSTKQNTLYDIDQAYWQVVSVKQKENLANSYLKVVKQLDSDVEKMIREGVATRADGLKVKVKVNEAEMNVTQAQDGLVLSKMLLCQLCGLPLDSDITLEDEGKTEVAAYQEVIETGDSAAQENRPELKLLQNSVDLAQQSAKLVRAEYLPHIALTGGYFATNPNLFNGFRNRFGGAWNVGVLVHVPLWNWMEGAYKVRAAKSAAAIAQLELAEAREKIELQVTQCRFKVKEAGKKLAMAVKNVEKAEENLRCANLGFHEGVMTATEVMEAQTAWVQALSQKIEAETDVQLTQVGLRKALGTLDF